MPPSSVGVGFHNGLQEPIDIYWVDATTGDEKRVIESIPTRYHQWLAGYVGHEFVARKSKSQELLKRMTSRVSSAIRPLTHSLPPSLTEAGDLCALRQFLTNNLFSSTHRERSSFSSRIRPRSPRARYQRRRRNADGSQSQRCRKNSNGKKKEKRRRKEALRRVPLPPFRWPARACEGDGVVARD